MPCLFRFVYCQTVLFLGIDTVLGISSRRFDSAIEIIHTCTASSIRSAAVVPDAQSFRHHFHVGAYLMLHQGRAHAKCDLTSSS